MVCIYDVSKLYSLVLKLESRICDHVLLDLLNLTFENDKKKTCQIHVLSFFSYLLAAHFIHSMKHDY